MEEIGAAVADIADIEHLAVQHHRGQCRPHRPATGGTARLVNGGVGGAQGAIEDTRYPRRPIGGVVASEDRVDRDRAGDLAVRVSPHAIGDRVEEPAPIAHSGELAHPIPEGILIDAALAADVGQPVGGDDEPIGGTDRFTRLCLRRAVHLPPRSLP